MEDGSPITATRQAECEPLVLSTTDVGFKEIGGLIRNRHDSAILCHDSSTPLKDSFG
jgi:hypothetical protein